MRVISSLGVLFYGICNKSNWDTIGITTLNDILGYFNTMIVEVGNIVYDIR